MPQIPFVTLDVFTTKKFTGNPLAIATLPAGLSLSTTQLQTLAAEFNLSETVFLHQDEPGRMRIFTTTTELPFAGHPTIGTAVYSRLETLVCNAGPIGITFSEQGRATASIPHNIHIHTSDTSINEDVIYDLQPRLQLLKSQSQPPIETLDVVSPVPGMKFICIRLASLSALELVQIPGRALVSEEGGFTALYFYVLMGDEDEGGRVGVRTRMVESTMEDPATGSAACALCALLALKEGGRREFVVRQGVEMGRESEIGVVVTVGEDGEGVERVELSGEAVKVMEGCVFVD